MNKNIFEEIFQKYAELWLSQLARDDLRVLEFAKMIFAQLSNRCGKSLKAIYILLDILKLMFFFFINESFVKQVIKRAKALNDWANLSFTVQVIFGIKYPSLAEVADEEGEKTTWSYKDPVG